MASFGILCLETKHLVREIALTAVGYFSNISLSFVKAKLHILWPNSTAQLANVLCIVQEYTDIYIYIYVSILSMQPVQLLRGSTLRLVASSRIPPAIYGPSCLSQKKYLALGSIVVDSKWLSSGNYLLFPLSYYYLLPNHNVITKSSQISALHAHKEQKTAPL